VVSLIRLNIQLLC